MRGVLEALVEVLRSRGGFDLEAAFVNHDRCRPPWSGEEPVQRLIGNNAYDSDQLDRELAETLAPELSPAGHVTSTILRTSRACSISLVRSS
jgi:hypothetical protein